MDCEAVRASWAVAGAVLMIFGSIAAVAATVGLRYGFFVVKVFGHRTPQLWVGEGEVIKTIWIIIPEPVAAGHFFEAQETQSFRIADCAFV